MIFIFIIALYSQNSQSQHCIYIDKILTVESRRVWTIKVSSKRLREVYFKTACVKELTTAIAANPILFVIPFTDFAYCNIPPDDNI